MSIANIWVLLLSQFWIYIIFFIPLFSFNFRSCASTSKVIDLAVFALMFTITILWSFYFFFPLSITCCFFLLLIIWYFAGHYIIILLFILSLDICHFYWYFIFYDFSNILYSIIYSIFSCWIFSVILFCIFSGVCYIILTFKFLVLHCVYVRDLYLLWLFNF